MPPEEPASAEAKHEFPIGKVFLGAVAVALVIIMAVVVSGARQEESVGPSQTLPDGTVLRLKAVVGGTNYNYSTKTRLQTFAEKLPSPLSRLLQTRGPYYQKTGLGPVRCLSVIFDTPAEKHVEVTGWDYRSVLTDNNGLVMEANHTDYLWPELAGSGFKKVLPAATFLSVPATTREFSLVLYATHSDDDTTPIAKWGIANPAFDPKYAPLAGKPLPQTASDAQLSVTLELLVTGVDPDWLHLLKDKSKIDNVKVVSIPAPSKKLPWTLLAYSIEEAGKPTDAWRIENLKATDAAGSPLSASSARQEKLGPFAVYQFQPVLWAGGGALNLALEFTRSKNYSPDELWTLDLAVPTTATLFSDGRSQSFGATNVTIEFVGGPGASSSRGGCTGNYMVVELAEQPSTKDRRVLHVTSAVDNFGRTLVTGCSSMRGPDAPGRPVLHTFNLNPFPSRYYKPLPAEPKITSVTMTIAFTRSHTLELPRRTRKSRAGHRTRTMKTLVFISGIDGTADLFRSVADQLKQHGWRVLFYEHAHITHWNHCCDQEAFAKEVSAFMDANSADTAVICGESFGGPIALTFARLYPQRTMALILLGTFAHLPFRRRAWLARVAGGNSPLSRASFPHACFASPVASTIPASPAPSPSPSDRPFAANPLPASAPTCTKRPSLSRLTHAPGSHKLRCPPSSSPARKTA